MSSRRRTPFGEATADIGNRENRQASTASSEAQKPGMILQQVPTSSMQIPGSSKSQSRPPRRGETPPRLGTAKVANVRDGRLGDDAVPLSYSMKDAARAREYKALAFEAGIRAASQEQRIVALLVELEEVKFFQKTELEGGSEAGGVEAGRIRNDAKLIDALAMELETTERDCNQTRARIFELEKALNQTRARVVELERDLIEVRSEFVNQKERWDRREAGLTKQLERQKLELDNAIKDARDGVSIVRELDGALRSARAERSEALSQVSTLRAEMKHMKEDAQRMAALMKEMEAEKDGALRSARAARCEARSQVSTMRAEMILMQDDAERMSALMKEMEAEKGDMLAEMRLMQDDAERMSALMREMEVEKGSFGFELLHELYTVLSDLLPLRKEVDGLREGSAKSQNLEQLNKKLREEVVTTKEWSQIERSMALSVLSSLREEVDGLRERLAKNENLEQSNKELQSVLEVVQSRSNKKMKQMKEAIKGAEEREEWIQQEHEKLRLDFLRQKNDMNEIKSAYNELSSKMNEEGKESANKTAANEEQISVRRESNSLPNADSKISSSQQEVTLLSAEASPTEKLHGDLAMAQRTDASLAKAVRDCKVPLAVPITKVLSGQQLDRSEPQETRKIEDDALKEYCLQRFG